jgi:hypothetical protein
MKPTQWILSVVVLGMMGGAIAYLTEIRASERLGQPGVRVGPVPLYGVKGTVVADQSVLLPETVLSYKSTPEPITDIELSVLPKDTTFGRRQYQIDQDFAPVVTVVLMGTDRASIHQPQFCLRGLGWSIDKTERASLNIQKPYPYEMQAMKLTTSMGRADAHGQLLVTKGLYVYWFVTSDKITPDQGTRLWSIAKTMVEKRELERWAYISYFVPCASGTEDATFDRLKKFIESSVPDFQMVAGKPTGGSAPVAALQ